MTTDRSYRPARSATAALAELRRCAGTQFDPDVVAGLTRTVESDGVQPAAEPERERRFARTAS
jgi:HD-GYP domain-containing protein (c-di-GMP phosphodiesterase class II)